MPQKSVLITGCSAGGIGSALALSFQKRGFLVFATARTTAKIPAALTALPNVVVLPLEVTSRESVAAAVESVKKTLSEGGHTPGLDVLVNNSGVGMTAPMLDTDIDKARHLFDVNFFGVVRVTQAFSPLLVQAKGTLVNISSIAGEVSDIWTSMYCASKAALSHAAEGWRTELKPLGVSVVTVVTGMIETEFYANHDSAEDAELPAESFYKQIEAAIAQKRRGNLSERTMKADVFAEKVVGDVVAGKTGKIWRGTLASQIRFITTFFPTSWIVSYCFRLVLLLALILPRLSCAN
ncbi:hypothetical protein B0T22DRAFT_525757 [Podospora appendiculata]|uniref:Ketoreductase domain-containing protein n=1 Tax=Podospora appendiculata TaxID=314037 RepID=A0AAE0XHB0_9PEZI|nr:hypothetical protein B0T22DRAFT_525757 [Podospora appendiculata]